MDGRRLSERVSTNPQLFWLFDFDNCWLFYQLLHHLGILYQIVKLQTNCSPLLITHSPYTQNNPNFAFSISISPPLLSFLILPTHHPVMNSYTRMMLIYLWMKVVVCFFCLSGWDLPNHISSFTVLVPLESPWWVEFSERKLNFFRTKVWEIFNFE